jgi:hypothetical protein
MDIQSPIGVPARIGWASEGLSTARAKSIAGNVSFPHVSRPALVRRLVERARATDASFRIEVGSQTANPLQVTARESIEN